MLKRKWKKMISLLVIAEMMGGALIAGMPHMAEASTAGSTSDATVVSSTYKQDTISIAKIASYSVGQTNKDGGVAEIVKYNKDNAKFYLVNGSTTPATLDIVPLGATRGSLTKEKSLNVSTLVETNGFMYGDLTSVDINTSSKRVAVAVQEKDAAKNGKILVLDYEGNLLNSYEAGVQPDMVKFTSDGRYILSADEGEPRVAGVDPEGSVTIVDTSNGSVTHVKFDNPAVIDNSVHIRGASDGTGQVTGSGTKADAVKDLEPEYIALSGDESIAYVSLQENNAIAAIDIASKSVISVKGLGYKDFSKAGNSLDLVNDSQIKLENVPFYGMYMPDGIAAYTSQGTTYLFSANEGDETDWSGRKNGSSIKNIKGSLNPTSEAAKFLSGTTAYDKVTVAGDMGTDNVYLYGGRSFSVWNAATMEQIYDSGNDFETITGERLPANFNASNDTTGMDKRSPKKGPEPEYVTIGRIGSKTYAFVGLERIGGVMTYDVTDPAHPVFANYINTRDFEPVDNLNTDTGPEGLEFIPASESPTGAPLLLVANEVGGTVAVLQINAVTVSGPSTMTVGETSVAEATYGATKLTAGSGVVFASSNAAVAEIGGTSGQITAKSAGQTVISATYGTQSDKYTLTVQTPSSGNIKVQLLAMNDLHGNIDSKFNEKDSGINEDLDGDAKKDKDLGGMQYMATYIHAKKAENPNTLVLHSGDMIGASPPLSALFHDEPTIEVLNEIGFDVGAVGNHEFDEGTAELIRMIQGGAHPDGTGSPNYAGMKYPILGANVKFKADHRHALPPYAIKEIGGVKIGFIGVVTEETPHIVIPTGIQDLEFTDAAEAVNEAAAELKAQGIKTIVVLAHMSADQGTNGAFTGEAVDLANKVDDEVDVIFAAHNHKRVNTTIDGKLVVAAWEYSKALMDVDLEIDRTTGNVVSKKGEILYNFRTVTPDSDVQAIIDDYKAKAGPKLKAVVGENVNPMVQNYPGKGTDTNGDFPLGNLIADAMKAEMNADFAMMNGGGVRAPLDAGPITWEELFSIQPFGNTLIKVEVTGADLKEIVEAQLGTNPIYGPDSHVGGFRYTWAQVGKTRKVFDLTFPDGKPIPADGKYTLVVNSFMYTSNDARYIKMHTLGKNSVQGPEDLQATVNFVKNYQGPINYVSEGRIREIVAPSSLNNANLKTLQLSGTQFGFAADKTEYALSVGNGVKSVTVTAEADASAAKVEINGEAVLSKQIDLSEGLNTVTVKVTAQDGTTQKTYKLLVTRAVLHTATGEPIPLSTSPVSINVPSGVSAKVKAAAETNGDTKKAVLPLVEVTASTSLGSVSLNIPDGAVISAPASWDGTIKLPEIQPNYSVSVRNGKVNAVVEVGSPDVTLVFDKAVRLLIPGQAGKKAGYARGGVFTPITSTVSADSQEAADREIAAGGEARIDVGGDLVIWTKHFTQFVSYAEDKKSSSSGSSSGGSGSGTTVTGTSGATVTENGVKIVIPAGAFSTDVKVTVEKVANASDLVKDASLKLVSDVFEIKKDKEGEFTKPVTITMPFDKMKVDLTKWTVSIYWLDETAKKWIELGNPAVDADNASVSGSVSHFTKFAVLAKEKQAEDTADGSAPSVELSDIKGHWAETNIRELVKNGAIDGYPNGTFGPEKNITRAEFAAVIVKALKLQEKSGKGFADTAGHWAKKSIETAAAYDIITGYSDTAFGPDDLITREQMAVMIARAAKLPAASGGKAFADNADIAGWAKDAVASAAASGLLNGYENGTFKPKANATRAEAATVILKAIKK
ncbi:choice-of-anchor I family protein [Paenibacillus hamazuiensis]|uniref:choice-of-anchor I family protein n=1 Tax=Paenibacillus hamazuiensis TaxID=2936508 RepID=UPI00200F54E0|nr:choice-of-anchor I family protein [Paenibacillus hamazuiensis]